MDIDYIPPFDSSALKDGEYPSWNSSTKSWDILAMPSDSHSSEEISPLTNCMGMRNMLLQLSDYVMMPDSPIDPSTLDAWKTYRQTLRDLPENDPNWGTANMIWPTVPEYKKG